MIYRIERRTFIEGGMAESHWELISYDRKTTIGILTGATTLFKDKSKVKVKKYANEKGIDIA